VIAGHFDRRIVAYPIACGDGKSKPLINWLCLMTVANDTPVREIWNRRVTQDHVLRLFCEWRTPWLDLPALIRRTPEIYEFPLADRDPVQAWTFGRVTLVGDAAHPMQPTGAQAWRRLSTPGPLQKRVTRASSTPPGNPLAGRAGFTDRELAELFDVSLSTIEKWKRQRDEFRNDLKIGKAEADKHVERSLYERATGYSYNTVKIFRDIEHVPPDVTAQIFWLKNRDPAHWRDAWQTSPQWASTSSVTGR
jgi:hypothetical protein